MIETREELLALIEGAPDAWEGEEPYVHAGRLGGGIPCYWKPLAPEAQAERRSRLIAAGWDPKDVEEHVRADVERTRERLRRQRAGGP
jgi:hypothetical protein